MLYTTGGPGGSSLRGVKFIYERLFIQDRDYIAFEQRGTEFAIPRLNCFEVNEAIKKSYREGLSRDSMTLEGVKACRKRLVAQGIDLSAYNTVESAQDIVDLISALKLDSVNLLGISYSGGLMMQVMRKDPKHVRSMILDSPLPGFVHYDEDGLAGINEAFNRIFDNCDRDSADKEKYGDLKGRFRKYFNSIANKAFIFLIWKKAKQTAYKSAMAGLSYWNISPSCSKTTVS